MGEYHNGHLEVVAEIAYQLGRNRGNKYVDPVFGDIGWMEINHEIIEYALDFEEVIWEPYVKENGMVDFFELIDKYIERIINKVNEHKYCFNCNAEQIVEPGQESCLNCEQVGELKPVSFVRDKKFDEPYDLTPRVVEIHRPIKPLDFVKAGEDIYAKGYVEQVLSNGNYYVYFYSENEEFRGFETEGAEIELMTKGEIECFLEDIYAPEPDKKDWHSLFKSHLESVYKFKGLVKRAKDIYFTRKTNQY